MTVAAMGYEQVEPQRAAPMSFAERAQLRSVSPPDPTTSQEVQAASEGAVVDDGNSIEFLGGRFRLAESIGLMPLLKFAHAAKTGLTSDDMEGLSAMYLLIRSCLDRSQAQATGPDGSPQFNEDGTPVWAGPSEWDRFELHAIEQNADGEDLSEFINQAVQVVSARPRKRRGGSSASSPQTSQSSKASSSSPVTPRVPAGFEGLTDVSTIGQAH
jgi:hypothetical protein